VRKACEWLIATSKVSDNLVDPTPMPSEVGSTDALGALDQCADYGKHPVVMSPACALCAVEKACSIETDKNKIQEEDLDIPF
jgi:hypothetical protein